MCPSPSAASPAPSPSSDPSQDPPETWETHPASPLFQTPSRPREDDEDLSPSSPPPPSWATPGASPSGSHDDSSTSGPRSTEASLSISAKKAELRKVMRAAVRTAGGMVHQLLTREGTPERAVELYRPDAEDEKAISEPLAGLASRRMPAGAENPDVTDLVQLVIGLAGYVVKQITKRAAIAEQAAPPADHELEPDEGGVSV